MPDTISTYRVVRLALHVPPTGSGLAKWSLIATGIKRGIPTANVLLDGRIPLPGPAPTTEEILEAIDALVRANML